MQKPPFPENGQSGRDHRRPRPPVLSPEWLAEVPRGPGVYLMRDDSAAVLYVGKARELRKRLAAYVRHRPGVADKTTALLARVQEVETILTRTEKEALILEASLIKRYRPRYNVILRDDKNYPFLKVTVQEEWPRLVMVRQRRRDNARYFGPFSSSGAMWESLRYLNGLFPLRRCRGARLARQERPCLNHQLGRCLAPCAGKVERSDYLAMVAQLLQVLEGRSREVISALQRDMEQAAAELRFEEAARCRDRLRALEKTLEKQLAVAGHHRDQDVFGLVRRDGAVAVAVLFVREGALHGQQTFFLQDTFAGDTPEVLAEVLRRFYQEKGEPPQEVLLPLAIEETELLADWLGEQRRSRVAVLVPRRGDKRRLVTMAEANAEQLLAERASRSRAWEALAVSLAKTLRLKRPPQRVECVDISNLGGEQAVGALVCFQDGEPHPAGFRRYRIRSLDTPDDYAMMEEVLERRLRRGREEDDLPDLLLLDGGKGQLRMALRVVARLGLEQRLELAAIAKERQDEGEKLFRPGRKNPLALAGHSPVLLFLMRVRDEAHRYGIGHHRRLRRSATLSSRLDRIPGVGPARRRALLATLGSVRRVRQAGVEELAQVPGIGTSLARTIWQHLHDRAGEGGGAAV